MVSKELKDRTDYLLHQHKKLFNQNPSKKDLMKHIEILMAELIESHESSTTTNKKV